MGSEFWSSKIFMGGGVGILVTFLELMMVGGRGGGSLNFIY